MQTKRKKNLDPDLRSSTGIKSEWITDLNVKCKTEKLLERGTGGHLEGPGTLKVLVTPPKMTSEFSVKTPKTQSTKGEVH